MVTEISGTGNIAAVHAVVSGDTQTLQERFMDNKGGRGTLR